MSIATLILIAITGPAMAAPTLLNTCACKLSKPLRGFLACLAAFCILVTVPIISTQTANLTESHFSPIAAAAASSLLIFVSTTGWGFLAIHVTTHKCKN